MKKPEKSESTQRLGISGIQGHIIQLSGTYNPLPPNGLRQR